jgi:hypothetical protein
MRKIIVFMGVILFFGVGFCFAQEEITITTYYPSPYGVYRELRVEDGDIVIVPDAFGGTARRTTDNNTIITGVGVTSDFALSVQDGNGRVQYYWNVDPSALTYLVNNEEAGVFNFHPPGASTFGSSSTSWVTFAHAPAGTAGTAISWTPHLEIQTDGDVIVPTGNVGIGTTNPGTKLAVTGLTSGGGNTLRIVPGTGNIYYEASSKKYKDNIQPLEDDFYKILKATPKSFVYKTTGEKDIGYIAEEFEELGLHNLLTYRDGQPDAIKYDLLSLYILEIIKDQQRQIENLRIKNKELEDRVKILVGMRDSST